MPYEERGRIWEEIKSLRRDRHDIAARVQKLFSDFDGHLLLCTERHKEIGEKLDQIAGIIKWVAALVIVSLIAVAAFFLKRDLFP